MKKMTGLQIVADGDALMSVQLQTVSRRDSIEEEDEEEVKVMLVWNEGKMQKSIRDLVLDHQPEDEKILTYYRYRH